MMVKMTVISLKMNHFLLNGKEDCQHGEDEWDEYQRHLSKGNIPLALVCDGENDLKWTNISNETDETHCEWWPCNNPYFECDNRCSAVQQTVQFDGRTVIYALSYESNWYCSREIPMLFENNKNIKCLCPSSYFGDR
ncbi:unnamed protein product [Rotaria sp. Silwood1]|nr:unnamed protein product [Rotaria sp. Silwood1]